MKRDNLSDLLCSHFLCIIYWKREFICDIYINNNKNYWALRRAPCSFPVAAYSAQYQRRTAVLQTYHTCATGSPPPRWWGVCRKRTLRNDKRKAGAVQNRPCRWCCQLLPQKARKWVHKLVARRPDEGSSASWNNIEPDQAWGGEVRKVVNVVGGFV